jgi:hypothetical protein
MLQKGHAPASAAKPLHANKAIPTNNKRQDSVPGIANLLANPVVALSYYDREERFEAS